MIVVTGVAGFIASALLKELNNKGYENIIIVDDFSNKLKNKNISNISYSESLNRDTFISWFGKNYNKIKFVFHLGARTDTAEFDIQLLNKLNLEYSKSIWDLCTLHQIPLIYASSAATYGAGENGYLDNHDIIKKLKPLNPYGVSKNEFDKYVLNHKETPPFWAGLKFFNVYGPNEYHKNRMASVVFHAYKQILKTKKLKLFRSHNKDFEDGKQLRDFIYVRDVINVCCFLMENQKQSGIFNLGTGKARTFYDLGKAVFTAMDRKENIDYIDIPEDIRDKYQYYTQAEMNKLISVGYDKPFYSIEDGIYEYVNDYLKNNLYY